MKKMKMLSGLFCCLLAFCFLFSVSGCGVANSMARNMSSGQVGCPPDDVVIENLVNGAFTNSWVAKCKGKTFYCSQNGDGPAYCRESATETAKGKK